MGHSHGLILTWNSDLSRQTHTVMHRSRFCPDKAFLPVGPFLARWARLPPPTPCATNGAAFIQGKFDLAKDQLATIEKLCGKECEYYQDLSEALEQAHAL
jgi:hypothetical protein